MEPQELLELIEAAGAEAYRSGRPYLHNPYYDSVNCPGATGEPLADWDRKVRAWERGWETERRLGVAPHRSRRCGANSLKAAPSSPP